MIYLFNNKRLIQKNVKNLKNKLQRLFAIDVKTDQATYKMLEETCAREQRIQRRRIKEVNTKKNWIDSDSSELTIDQRSNRKDWKNIQKLIVFFHKLVDYLHD